MVRSFRDLVEGFKEGMRGAIRETGRVKRKRGGGRRRRERGRERGRGGGG